MAVQPPPLPRPLKSILGVVPALLILVFLAACNADPARPTPTPVLPTVAPASETPLPGVTPTASPALTSAPTPTFRSMMTSTAFALTSTAPAVALNVPPPTLTPICLQAIKGDTIFSILARGGAEFGIADAFRAANGIAPGGSLISEGSRYCIPARTFTPTPPGYEKTVEAMASILPTRGAITYITHKVVANDTTLGLELKYGVTLGEICRLNPLPDGLDCLSPNPRCNLNAPLGGAGCRVVLSIGKVLRLPGPPPTATITPTLTGSETVTPTPGYSAPRILAPENGATVQGQVRLRWLPAGGILKADERYMLLMSSSASGKARNFQYFTDSTSFLVPPEALPAEAGPHTIYWQVSIVALAPDGTALVVSNATPTGTFIWTR